MQVCCPTGQQDSRQRLQSTVTWHRRRVRHVEVATLLLQRDVTAGLLTAPQDQPPSCSGLTPALRSEFINAIFGDGGLVTCADVSSSTVYVPVCCHRFQTAFARTYFKGLIVHFLKDNVTAGCHGWTDNACKSLNHTLKRSVQWQPTS